MPFLVFEIKSGIVAPYVLQVENPFNFSKNQLGK